ncbi:MAG: serine protease [Bacillus sp. (in: Bacteria)]|nr:serine protease [Bacillus sp. (in: firmicutes)]MCM1426756.1 serine protease [Eubacterium sp.]
MKRSRLLAGGSICTKIIAALIIAAAVAAPLPAEAMTEPQPHLIQTVTEKDIFEGLLAYGFLECRTLETDDCEAAYENVKDCIVLLRMQNAYGSGVVFEMTPERIVIATNKHVLEYWEDGISYVQFPQGYFTEAKMLAVSEEYDIGFLAVDCAQFDYPELEQIRYVHYDEMAYQALTIGDAMFCAGAEDAISAQTTADFFQGSIGDTWRYIEEFEEYMLYGYGYAREGMSGGGSFDAKGNFIGIISGATMSGETASVPLPFIIEAYENIEYAAR